MHGLPMVSLGGRASADRFPAPAISRMAGRGGWDRWARPLADRACAMGAASPAEALGGGSRLGVGRPSARAQMTRATGANGRQPGGGGRRVRTASLIAAV